ncbi:MAG: N-acetylmuramoyl-L-alanine amidase [Opitutaceae bacterium]
MPPRRPPVAAVFRCLSLALAGVLPAVAAADPAATLARATAAVQAALAAPGAPWTLRGATLEGHRLTLDLTPGPAAPEPGTLAFEQHSRGLHRAAAGPLAEAFPGFELHTLLNGEPLDRLLAARDPRPTLPPGPPRAALLAGRRIAVSPGHGYYQNAAGNWVLQRGTWQGIVEDFVNHDFITLLRDELAATGAEVLSTRQLDRGAGTGESGFPRWQEAARYHVKALGAPATVWNEPGFDHLSQDIRCRPLWANHVGADLLVSLHNNGGGGTGTETLYDTSNGFGPESKRLAEAVHGRVIAALRRDYLAAWADRRVQGFNGSYGENRLATRPAILIEVAFMDRPTPDNAAIQDERFRALVARAIREGVQDYLDGLAPAVPADLAATATSGGVRLAWRSGSAQTAAFRLERRVGEGAWTALTSVGAAATEHLDATAPAGSTLAYRVAAVNAAGASFGFSNEATLLAAAPPPVGPANRPGAWLGNLSLRTNLPAEQGVTVGFVVAGGARRLLVRAAGPALGAFGLTGALPDPRLDLYRGAERVAGNNDWPAALTGTMAALGAFPFPTASRDASLLASVEGPHTAVVAGPGGGAVLVEAYDSGGQPEGRLVNLSARHRAGAGADVLIVGFHLAGQGPARVLLRAAGPGLAALGVPGTLADPRLEVYDERGVRLAENDQWDATLAPVFAAAGAFSFPAGSRDAALVATLTAGRSYTVQISGPGTGEALVEIYALP